MTDSLAVQAALFDLAQLCAEVEGGCSITVTNVNVPPRGTALYGRVQFGNAGMIRTFASTEELLDILKKHRRKK